MNLYLKTLNKLKGVNHYERILSYESNFSKEIYKIKPNELAQSSDEELRKLYDYINKLENYFKSKSYKDRLYFDAFKKKLEVLMKERSIL